MLKKVLISSLITASLLYSEELKNDKFEIIAEKIDTKEDGSITAKGNVVVYSSVYYLNADRIVYNKKDESFELFNNVLILKDNNIQSQSEYAKVTLEDNSYKQSPVFILDKQNELWFSSESSNKKKNNIELGETIISSCDCVDPVWSIKVSSANFNTEKKWLHTFNPRLYIKNVPILYSPYFGFPTNKNRKTGLLIPTIGYSKDEGLYYAQPVFVNLARNYDLELIPQVRSQRGYGLYTYFRYADSNSSLLKIKTGLFKEKSSFQKENSLKNQKHYGWNIDYEKRNIFSSSKSNDGFYASLNWLNDIEYKTLEHDDVPVSTEKKIESKINYFYDKSQFYTGIYNRFYLDTAQDSNDTTLQELPQLQFHLYNRELVKRLVTSMDVKYQNYTRKTGLAANIYEMTLPLSYNKYFFDEYLSFNITNSLVIDKYEYKNDSSFKDATLIQNELAFALSTDLIKAYTDYLHTINFNVNYIHPRNLEKTGDIYGITSDDSKLKIFPSTQGNKNINLSFNQSLYEKENIKQLINHKISQAILFDKNDKAKLQNLENYLKFYFNNGELTNKLIYNIQDKAIIENMYDLKYKYEDLSFDLGYYTSKNTPNSGKEDLESYNVKVDYQVTRDYKLGYYENYNLKDKIRNKQGIIYNINDRCWSLDLKYEKEVVPSTSNTSSSNNQSILYMNLKLKPLGGLKQKYKFEDKNNE